MRGKLETMRRIVLEDRTDPRLRQLVARIWRERGLTPRDTIARAAAVLAWVQANVTYINEPVETFTRPRRMLEEGWLFGDCDEFATLLAALYESAGYDSRFAALAWGRPRPIWRHVYAEVALPPGGAPGARRWYAAEGTLPVPFGWNPAAAARTLDARST